MSFTPSLISDATNHLNGRSRGRDARLARLAAGGVPTDRDGMSRWLSDALDSRLEAEGGVYHCCTARVSNGVDAELPQRHGVGCRISRVPVSASLVTEDEDSKPLVADEDGDFGPYWCVYYGTVGTGYMAPRNISLSEAETAGEAEQIIRNALLAGAECVKTRAEAVVLVESMLNRRLA